MMTKQSVNTSFVVIVPTPFHIRGPKKRLLQAAPLQGTNRLPFMAEPQYYSSTYFDKKQGKICVDKIDVIRYNIDVILHLCHKASPLIT